jgi:parvulin-like peptidyl-prolyl isomerase
MLKSLAREPLVHFLLLGAALFLLDAWLRPAAAPAAASEIVVSEARIRNLAQNFRRTWQRPPTRQELDGLVEAHVREEVLYREALALGLDRDDAIIRRRLQQKMEFIAEEAAALAQPTDRELEQYLTAHADSFRVEPRITFSQVFLDPRRRAATLDADTKRLLGQLNAAKGATDPTREGDRLMLLEPRYEKASASEVARLFGADFAEALVRQPVGKWTGPVASGYGVHLVNVESLTPGGTPALDEVRPLVAREWSNARRQETARAFYERLRAKYTISVQMPEAAKP